MTPRSYVPDAGDLIWTDFDPARGREQAGRRPALVVSPAVFTENTGLAVVCPIISRVRPFPTSVVLPTGLPVAGEILTSDIRSVDTHAWPVRYAGAVVGMEVAHFARANTTAFLRICRRRARTRKPPAATYPSSDRTN